MKYISNLSVVEVKISKITAERQGYRITRKASQFRKLKVNVKGKAESDDDTKDVKSNNNLVDQREKNGKQFHMDNQSTLTLFLN